MRPTGRHVSGHSPNSSGTATEKPLEAPASRGFSFWPKTDERPSPIALARRATMDAAFSDACVRILNVTGCAGQAEPARRMGARQAAISDSRRRGQTGSEILPALLKRLGLAPQYGRSAHALTSKRPGTPMVPGLSHGSCLAGLTGVRVQEGCMRRITASSARPGQKIRFHRARSRRRLPGAGRRP